MDTDETQVVAGGTDERRDQDPVFRDALFRQKRKKGAWRIVEPPVLEAPVADTHAHLQLLFDPALALARCAVHNVEFICTIVDAYEDGSTTFDDLHAWSFEAGVELRRIAPRCCEDSYPRVPHVRIATGCHPHNAKHYDDALEVALRARLTDPRVAAVGEIGLDYHYDFSSRDDQRMAFRRQIRLAKECELPVILHVRQAHDEAYHILADEGFPEAGTLLHCYNLDWPTLGPWLEAGCFVAYGGPVTFKKSDDTREAAARTPLDRLLTETDAPYMTPEPMRGVTCGPEHVIFTAARLAEVRGCAGGEERAAFLRVMMDNARGLLDRKPTAWQLHGAMSATQSAKSAQPVQDNQEGR